MSSSFPQPRPRLSSSEFLVHFHYAKRNLRIIGPVSKYILYTINILAFIRSMAKCVCTKAACQGDEGTSGESKKRHRKTVTYIMYGNISCNGVRFHFIIPLFLPLACFFVVVALLESVVSSKFIHKHKEPRDWWRYSSGSVGYLTVDVGSWLCLFKSLFWRSERTAYNNEVKGDWTRNEHAGTDLLKKW